MGICTYMTICFICFVIYGELKTRIFELYPNIKYPDLLNIIIFIGTVGLISVLYSHIIQKYFVDEPTIKIKITKTKTETL